jgi:photosystem II stability/assembly factor-like uncharacterized protein
VIGGEQIALSTDAGISWASVYSGSSQLNSVSFADSLNGWAVGVDKIVKTTDGGYTWHEQSWPSPTGYLTAVHSPDNQHAWAIGDGIVLKTTDGGETININWIFAGSGLNNTIVYSLGANGNNLFAGTLDGVFRSTNNGSSWIAVDSGLTNIYVNKFIISRETNLFAGTQGGGIFLSTNNGNSWTTVNSGLTSNMVYSFAVIDTNLFAGTYAGVFVSSDNGASWRVVNYGLTSLQVWSLGVNGTNLFAGTSDGVFLSTNNGNSWAVINSGMTNPYVLTNPSIWSLAVSGINIFAGTSLGVFLSTDNGTNWNAINYGLPITDVYALMVSDNNLFAGVWLGVWRRPLTAMPVSVENESSRIPMTSILNQNYPNPFNPSTTITFSLSTKSFVSLKVYDLLGREVATLVSEVLSTGAYTRQWNAAKMSSGIYFYRLQAGLYTETKKLILLR